LDQSQNSKVFLHFGILGDLDSMRQSAEIFLGKHDWTAFSAAATLLQWLLESLALITPMMAGTDRVLAGVALIGAGVYQWLPIKQSCLSQCRAPLSFVQRHGGFQASVGGSVRLGVLHGAYCIGCCWTLMVLLFAFGVMNFYWIAGLMIFVLLEKVMPNPLAVSRVAGLAAIAAGIIEMGTFPVS
jgi:predicted metal-binding membrane protein